MKSPGIRDLLASFSPSSDFFAIASADGRIKIWDTLKGQVQAEFSDFKSASDVSELLFESKKGHLALDYKCMKWVQLDSKKKKKKNGNSLLVLGTNSGDVLAVEVSTGELRWRVCDCHSGGVSAISFSSHSSFLFTAGLDGMVCQIDFLTGSVIRKFRSSTKGISTLAISADGNMLAVAAGLLKVFSCTDHNKIQKFSGHPVSVRCMIFGEDGRSILTSGVGERHIAIWKLDGTKKKGASCVLSMDHPAVFLDSRGSDKDGSELQGLYVLALSEIGVCYFWHGKNLEELKNVRATKISLTVESSLSKQSKNQTIFAAKLESIVKFAAGFIHVAHGSLVKPSFEKLKVEHGIDLTLNTSKGGILLPVSQSFISNKGDVVNAAAAVTALDSANAEDAILPIPRLHVNEKKRKHGTPHPASDFDTSKRKGSSPKEVPMQRMEVEEPICFEDKLRAAGILGGEEKLEKDFPNGFDDAKLPRRKIRSRISKMRADDACKMLEILIQSWKTRSASSNHLFPWIYYILVIHGQCIISPDFTSDVIHNLEKITRLKAEAASIHPLLKLSGRLQLIMSQIDKACWRPLSSDIKEDDVDDDDHDDEEEGEGDDEDDDDVDEVLYDEDYESDSDD